MTRVYHIYFHSPCFDGIASAVIVWDWLQTREDRSVPYLHPVNYEMRGEWLNYELTKTSIIVDFLYHPEADFWADHHLTSFIDDRARKDFKQQNRPVFVYDDRADSCAGLLWKYFFEEHRYREKKYEELVKWANKIDAAKYSSVDEVFKCDQPALRINLSLALGDSNDYSVFLVKMLFDQSVEEVANMPIVQERFSRARSLMEIGLKRFEEAANRDPDGFVIFDINGEDAIISRYTPYYFYRDARYSVGIVRFKDQAKIVGMRNPWFEFESVPLGKVFERFGGGGHRRVAAVELRGSRARDASNVLEQILSAIRQTDALFRPVAASD